MHEQDTFFLYFFKAKELLRGVRLYKLIALDLDGTLLDDQKKISKENLDFINDATMAGYEIVIATGRRYFSAKELTTDIPNEMTILANNGNIIRNSLSDKILYNTFMDKGDIEKVLTMGKSYDLHPIVHVDHFEKGIDMLVEKYICDGDNCIFLPIGEKRFEIISTEELFEQDRVLALVYPGERARLTDFYEELNDRFPEVYNSHVLENLQTVEAMLEIMNPLGSKWKSLVEYAATKGIKPEEIIAIGDDNNDLEMILHAGLGISMKNGSDLTIEAADLVSERDNNDSGVAFELRRVLGL